MHMDEVIWNKMCDDVLQQMSEHVEPFLSPVWKFKEENDVRPHGTGSYIELRNRKFLITNEHVAKYNQTNRLTHSFHANENIFALQNKFVSLVAPVDVAIGEINGSLWDIEAQQAEAIPLNRFAVKHGTVEEELLFFAGFSGQRAKEVFGTLASRGTPFLTRECPLPVSVDEARPDYHLAIPYPPELARSADPAIPLPDPHGFSGSLLWDTKRIECLQSGKEWHPSMALVTGIIWAWPSSAACILATKVERLELVQMIEAYDTLK